MAQQQYISLDNKYSKTYYNLVNSRKELNRQRSDKCYYENHHIIPKSLGGSNKKDNMVLLTPREHCIAHLLLVRMYSGLAKYKMQSAINWMTRSIIKENISSRTYELVKNELYQRNLQKELWKNDDYIKKKQKEYKEKYANEDESIIEGINMRPLCVCGQRPAAINYKKKNKVYYRKLCETCLRNGLGHGTPRWKLAGYEKKSYCEKCGYKSNHSEQFNVYHVDGNLENCRPTNLKTICANCQRIIQKEGYRWRQGDLKPDF